MHTITCKACGNPFEASRLTAESCSPACRKRFYRANRAAKERERLARLAAVLDAALNDKEPTA